MSITSSTSLIDVLREWQFLEASQLDRLARNRLFAYADPRELARDLVHRGWLSIYQANRLIQGHGHELVLGPYRLIEPLGEGSMGRVFKARDVRMGRLVALKIIHKERLSSLRAIEHMYHEATIVTRLAHPNIVRAFGAGKVGSSYVFATEYLPGLDLEQLVQKKGRLPVAEACAFIRQACLGLDHAHQRGVVHRNIKPSNLLVTQEGPGKTPVVKLVDFCLSLLEGEAATEPANPTPVGRIMGTLDFLSPEQAADPRTADIRSDIFSLGCTLFYLLTARLPFEGKGPVDNLLARYREGARPLGALLAGVPAGLDEVVAKMLARDPGQRYQNPGEAAAALAPFVFNCVSGSVSPPPAAIPISPVRKPPAPTPRSLAVEPGDVAPSGDDLASSPLDLLSTDLKGGKRYLAGAGILLFLAAITTAAAFLGHGPKPNKRPKAQVARLGEPAASVLPKPIPAKAKPAAKVEEKAVSRPQPRIENKPAPKTIPEKSPETQPRPKTVSPTSEKTEPAPKPTGTPNPTPKAEPKTKIDPKPAPKPVVVQGKLPVPDRAAQVKAETLIKDLFKPEYSRKTPADLRALAEKLHQQGLDTRDDLAARFVLFREANDLASQAGELEEAFKAVTIMDKEYAVDALAMKAASLATASRTAKSPAVNKLIAEAALPLVNEAVDFDRYDVALRLLAVADMTARRSPSGLLGRQVEIRDKDTREIEMEYKRVKPALNSLLSRGGEAKNADPKDCLAAGKFLCLMKGDWSKGLPLLTQGNDDNLRTLAKNDRAAPTEAAAQVKVGDDWWDLAETRSSVARKQLRIRARYWYKQALPELKGLTRTKVERRIHPPRS